MEQTATIDAWTMEEVDDMVNAMPAEDVGRWVGAVGLRALMIAMWFLA